MLNYTILGVSHSPLFLEMAKTWPFYGQNMVLKWSSSWSQVEVVRVNRDREPLAFSRHY